MFDHMYDSKEIAKKEFESNMKKLLKLTRQLRTIDFKIYGELRNINEELFRVYSTLFNNK